MVIARSHESVKHNGVRETLTQVRSDYWIPKGRQVVKSLLSKCVNCKRITGRAYDTPVAPPLPNYRVSEESAFTFVAVDFAGPLYVKDIYANSDQMYKCYIALFSCASTRALHLELVPNLLASSFIRALKRMMSRRGLSSLIISDNGQTFLDKKVQTYTQNLNIVWKFNVPTASWWGGFWEVCVKLTKRCLKKTLGNAKLSYEELETVLIETEGILNSRPLTYIHEEITESPLTPSCLVIGRRILDKQDVLSSFDPVVSDRTSLTKRAIYLETVLSHFRNRFKTEYLPSLREHHRMNNKTLNRVISVGDIVHIFKDKIPRQCWSLGKVIRLLPGKDGITRAAEVKTHTTAKEPIILRRPNQKLFPLEVRNVENIAAHAEHEVDEVMNTNDSNNIEITMIKDEDVAETIIGH